MTIDLSKFTATELDKLIADAAKLRANIQPNAVGERPETVDAVIDPAWFVAPVQDGTIMQITHPSFGWLAFFIPAKERAALLSFLLQQSLGQVVNSTSTASASASPTATPIVGGGGKLH